MFILLLYMFIQVCCNLQNDIVYQISICILFSDTLWDFFAYFAVFFFLFLTRLKAFINFFLSASSQQKVVFPLGVGFGGTENRLTQVHVDMHAPQAFSLKAQVFRALSLRSLLFLNLSPFLSFTNLLFSASRNRFPCMKIVFTHQIHGYICTVFIYQT